MILTVLTGAGTSAAVEPPTPPPAAVAAVAAVETVRVAGATRYDTSVEIAKRFPRRADVVFVATGVAFPDALTGAAAAAAAGGPLLLTAPDVLPDAVRRQITALAPRKIYVLGQTGAVSASVYSALARLAPEIERIGRADRYTTAEAVVDEVFISAPRVFMATGRGFADALPAGAAAGHRGAPLLVIDGSQQQLGPRTLIALRRWKTEEIVLSGGHGAIDLRIEQQLRNAGYTVSRYSGASRFETATALYDGFFAGANPPSVFVSTGMDFPDALSASALAGRLGSPLLLTRFECVPWAAHERLSALAAQRVVVGGTGVVSRSAAANTPCSSAPPPQDPWAIGEWDFDGEAAVPYSDRPPVNVHDPAVMLDETGLRIYLRRDNRERADHPVAYAQYGISALMEYQSSGEQVWLDRTIRHAERLTEIRAERDGAWWFPYMFRWTYYQRGMEVPWWSGMAQGQALSLFVRLYETTGETRWRDAADRTWAGFLQTPEAGLPWTTMVDDGLLWFEEYVGNQPPLLVYNGHVFALFGLYDYWRLTREPEVRTYLAGATTTALEVMPRIRVPGEVSYYCLQDDYCESPLWQNSAYHPIHSWQLDTLARLTREDRFAVWAQQLREDWSPAAARFATSPSFPLGWEDGPPQ